MGKELIHKKCIPCTGATPPLKGEELKKLQKQLPPGWGIVENSRLEKSFKFKNFKQALDFVNEIGYLAEEEGHHPDIHFGWGYVKLIYSTHKIKGLTESDFIMAVKSEALSE